MHGKGRVFTQDLIPVVTQGYRQEKMQTTITKGVACPTSLSNLLEQDENLHYLDDPLMRIFLHWQSTKKGERGISS